MSGFALFEAQHALTGAVGSHGRKEPSGVEPSIKKHWAAARVAKRAALSKARRPRAVFGDILILPLRYRGLHGGEDWS